MAVERTAEQTGPSRLLTRRSLIGVLTGGALAATVGVLASPPDSQKPLLWNRVVARKNAIAEGVVRGIENAAASVSKTTEDLSKSLWLPRSAEAGPADKIYICNTYNEEKLARIPSTGAVRTSAATNLGVEALSTSIPFRKEDSTWGNYTVWGTRMHPLNHPEWPNGQVEVNYIFLAFKDQLAEVQKLDDPSYNYDNKMQALLASGYPFLENFYGQKFTTKKYELGGGFNYLPVGNSTDYSGPSALHAYAISQLAPEKYKPGLPMKALFFGYLTADNQIMGKFQFSGGLKDGFGSVMFAVRYLDIETSDGKLDVGNIVTAVHELHHAVEGKGHYEDYYPTGTENSINKINPTGLPYYVITRTDAEGLGEGKLEPDPYLPNGKPRVYGSVTFSNKSN